MKTVNLEKYTRFPVYEENLDNIIGILHVKDLIQFIESGDRASFNLRNMLREPYYILESMRIDQLFRDMQKNNIHMAIAIDEYGGTDGIVTIEDLIEEIVGNIFDEYDEPELEIAEIEQLDALNYVMAGTLNLYEVEEVLKVELPNEEYDTLSGFILGHLGYIPGADETPAIEYKHIVFAVTKMDDRRIERVHVCIKEPVAERE
jgi:putative hemolysin